MRSVKLNTKNPSLPEHTTDEDEDPELDPTDVMEQVDVILLIEEFLVGGGGGAPLNGVGGRGPILYELINIHHIK